MAKAKGRQPSAAARGPMRSLSLRLRQLREDRRLSQREFAELVGIAVMQINRYERGLNVPSIETTVRMAEALHISIDELLTGKGGDPEVPVIRSPKLYERFRRLDTLPKPEQEMAISLLDGVLAKHELARLAGQMQHA
jgi:transcriptional regulator with XRE-family HTH domain